MQPLAKLNDRHKLIALMIALGRKHVEIAAELGISTVTVSTVSRTPAFQLQVKHIQEQIQQETTGAFMDRVMREGPATLAKLTSLRDGARKEETQLSAAGKLWDTIVPKRTYNETDTTYRLVVEADGLRTLAKAIAEDEGRTLEIEDAVIVPNEIRAYMPDELARDRDDDER